MPSVGYRALCAHWVHIIEVDFQAILMGEGAVSIRGCVCTICCSHSVLKKIPGIKVADSLYPIDLTVPQQHPARPSIVRITDVMCTVWGCCKHLGRLALAQPRMERGCIKYHA